MKNTRILVVDDTYDNLAYLSDILEVEDYEVHLAENGKEGLKVAQDVVPDLILLDIMMPDIDGYEVCRQLKANVKLADIPVIFISALGETTDKVRGFSVGAVDYITKPFQHTEVIARIQSHMELVRLRNRDQEHIEELLQEIDARRQAELLNSQLLDALTVGVFIILKDRIVFSNPMMRELTAYSDDELKTMNFDILVDELMRNQVHELMQKVHNQAIFSNINIQIIAKDGTTQWVHLSLTPIYHQGMAAVLGAMSSIDELKILQTDLKSALIREQAERELTQALLDTALSLNSSDDLDTILSKILHNLRTVITADWANIMLIRTNHIDMVAAYGYSEDLQEDLLDRDYPLIGNPLLGHIQSQQTALIIDDVETSTYWSNDLGAVGVRAYLGCPIVLAGEVIGFLNIESQQIDSFLENDIPKVQAFANQIALAIQNERAHEQTQELAAQDERQRIARELHDAVSQTLFSANMIAETLPRLIDGDIEDVREKLVDLSVLTKGALAEMRTLLVELRPSALEDTDFVQLLTNLSNGLRPQVEAEVLLNIQCDETELDTKRKVNLYRITQEALNNILKHARAKKIGINFRCSKQCLELLITDDGCGFDPDTTSAHNMGLHIMRERALEQHLHLEINSVLNEGTQIKVSWSNGDD